RRLCPPRSSIAIQPPDGLPLPIITFALPSPMQEARFFMWRVLLPFRCKLDSHGVAVHRVGILLSRNRIRLTGYRRRFLNGHHGDARLDLALCPVVPPEEESNLILVVHGLYPEIVNAVDKVPRLVSDLSAHPDDPPRP